MRERTIAYLRLADIRGANENPKKHDAVGIAGSISEFGLGELPLLDERTDRIVAGHGRIDDLRERQATGSQPPPDIRVDDDGEWLVPVQAGWSSADDAHARAYVAASNKLTETGGWDTDLLGPYLQDLDADGLLELSGFTDADLAALVDTGTGGGGEGLTDPDDVPEPPAEPVSALGDLWLLGRHRLLCGDADDVTAIDRLLDGARPSMLLMDPPYGMHLDTDYSAPKGSAKSIGRARRIRGNTYAPVIGDDEDFDPQPLLGIFDNVVEQFWWGADYYAERIPERVAGSWLVWDKRKESQADAIGAEFELCWSRRKHKRRMLRHDWFGFASSESGAEARNRVHPTQKPVALYGDILRQWGTADGLVLDLYAGSGTTVLACHGHGMTAAVMELSPAYVDVICLRFQKATGMLPVLEATGEPHDFTAQD